MTAIIIIVIWILTLKFRHTEATAGQSDGFHELWGNLKKFKDIKLKP